MSLSTLQMTDELLTYLRRVGVREPDVLGRLRRETAPMANARMQIAMEQGALMALLAQLIGARSYLEVGVFTGYSSLAVALAMPSDARITACDISDEWTTIARRYWREAGVSDRIDLRLAPAVDTLDALLADGRGGHYDLAFIDADKESYPAYYERCLELLRPGGLLMVDNVLWGGAVVDAAATSADALAIRAFNLAVSQDDRVNACMLPIADGLTLAVKRPSVSLHAPRRDR